MFKTIMTFLCQQLSIMDPEFDTENRRIRAKSETIFSTN